MPVDSTQALATARLLHLLAERRGSDLHLVPGSYPMMRVDGLLQPIAEEAVVTNEVVTAAADFLLTPEQRTALERDRHVMVVYNWEGRGRFRVEAQFELNQLSLALRYIAGQVTDLATLQAPVSVQRLAEVERGLVIIAGPVGSGRTTMAAALINGINNHRPARIVTIEQPVEYLFVANKSLIEQREVGRDVQSIAEGLSQGRSGDIDVILASPVVSSQDWHAVMEAVEAGKMVIAVTAGESAASTLEHIHASFQASEQSWVRNIMCEALVAVVVLRLLPKVGGGEAMAFEVVSLSNAVQAALREGRFWQLPAVIQTSRQEGMQSMEYALAQLVRDGTIEREDALAQVSDQRAFLALVR